MREFAAAAVVHAAEQHGETLTDDAGSVATVDRILDRIRDRIRDGNDVQGRSADLASLALCYGSWLGETACRHLPAAWVGLHEPHPPRLEVVGVLCSPIDAVARRLAEPGEPALAARWQEMLRWVEAAPCSAAVRQVNQRAWDGLVGRAEFASAAETLPEPPSRDQATAALDPWLAELPRPCRLLCLAAGGGRHSSLYARAGFQVTVFDLSPAMLAIDARLAAAHRLDVATVQGSMDDLSRLAEATFDCVVQPVSGCYVPDIQAVHREVARVLRDGGLYLVQHKQPASLQAGGSMIGGGFQVLQPAFAGQPVRRTSGGAAHLEAGTEEFIHPLGSLLGGLCQAEFVIEGVAEPPRADIWATHDSSSLRACYLPPYLKIKARRKDRQPA